MMASHFFSHKGEEMGYVLSGTLALWVDGQRQEAGTGDFVYLTKQIPEQWENVGENIAELLVENQITALQSRAGCPRPGSAKVVHQVAKIFLALSSLHRRYR